MSANPGLYLCDRVVYRKFNRFDRNWNRTRTCSSRQTTTKTHFGKVTTFESAFLATFVRKCRMCFVLSEWAWTGICEPPD
jgi:hypothetical protein